MTTYRLSPGIVSGHWNHDTVTNVVNITLKFAGINTPVELTLTGDVPAVLAGTHKSVWGYKKLPAGQEPNETGAASDSVAAFEDSLRANASGWITKAELDDARGIELVWRDERHAIVGNVRFATLNPRALPA